MERKIEYRQLVFILVLFMMVQFLGLLTVFYFIPPSLLESSVTQVSASAASSAMQAIYFFFYIILGTVVLLLIFRFYHGSKIYPIIEGIVVVSASFYFFIIILSSLFPQESATYYVAAASVAIPVILLVAKYKKPQLRNTVAIIASTGAGIVLGLVFPLFEAFIFMAIIAVYDYVSVFVTRHMLTLGREAVNRNMALLIGASDIELMPKEYLSKKAFESFRKHFKTSSIKDKKVRALIKQGAVPVPTQAALGTGDLAIPLMLAVSAYVSTLHYFTSLAITASATLGLVFTMYMLKNYKIALPAIPPLFSFISLGMAVEFAFTGHVLLSIGLVLIGSSTIALMLLTALRVSKEKGRSVF
ncbi:MAG: presenilin family intramembrane aspartyl protease [Candidatus Micrarchaeia archaeon]